MSNFEHRITEDSTEFEKAFLKIYDGNLWTALDKMKDWQPPKPREIPVEIPQRFVDWFEEKMAASFLSVVSAYSFSDDKDIKWIRDNGGINLLCKMKLYGYTVKKEQMFYLKNVMTNNYLMQHKLDFRFGESDSKEDSPHWQTKFNQSEIDKLNTGSYEQIEVEP